MTDETTQVDGNQTDTIADDSQTKTDTVDIAKQSDSDFMSDTVDFIKDARKTVVGNDDGGGSDTDGSDDSEIESGTAVAELAGTDIPDAYSDAAEASGMTPSDIIKYANSHTNEELIEEAAYIRETLKALDAAEDDKAGEQGGKTKKDDDNKTIDAELEAKIADRIAKQLEEKFGTSLEEIEKFKVHQKEQASTQMAATVSKIFDDTSKEFPVFGKTDELPKFPSGRLAGQWIPTSPAMKARLETLRYANAFMAQGASIDDAMNNALATYRGKYLVKELQRKQVRDLKQHETKLSGARVGRETRKKYADTRDEIIDDIRTLQRAAGIE